MTPYQQKYRASRGYCPEPRTATARDRFDQVVADLKALPRAVLQTSRQVVGIFGTLALWSIIALIGAAVAIAAYSAPVEWLLLAAVLAIIWAHHTNH